MESHRMIIFAVLFIACALAVDAAAIENPIDTPPAIPNAPVKPAEDQPQPDEHHREKKFVPVYGYGYYGYPTAYSALSYYPTYRALPYYSPYYY